MITVIEPFPDWNKMRLWRLILSAKSSLDQRFRFVVSKSQHIDFVPEYKGKINYEKYVAASLPRKWWDCVEIVDCLDDEKLESLVDELPDESEVYIWNGQRGRLPEVCALHSQRLKFTFFELAWMPQSENIWSDPIGINGASSLSLMCESRVGGVSSIENPKSVLIILQLESDTNITRFSPFSTMEQFVRHTLSILPESVEKIAVRPHPRDRGVLALSDSRMHFSKMSLHEDIVSADVVFSINSTAIIECLRYGKPVVSFGTGIFSNKKVCFEASVEDAWGEIVSKRLVSPEHFLAMLSEKQVSIATLLGAETKVDSVACAQEVSKLSAVRFGRGLSFFGKVAGVLLKPYFYLRYRAPLTTVY